MPASGSGLPDRSHNKHGRHATNDSHDTFSSVAAHGHAATHAILAYPTDEILLPGPRATTPTVAHGLFALPQPRAARAAAFDRHATQRVVARSKSADVYLGRETEAPAR